MAKIVSVLNEEALEVSIQANKDDTEPRADTPDPLGQEIAELPSKDESLQRSYYYRALLDEFIYEESSRKLIPTDHVRDLLALIGSKFRTLLSQLPDRLTPRVTSENDEETIYLLISREVEAVAKSIIDETSTDKIDDLLDSSAKDPVIKSRKISMSHR